MKKIIIFSFFLCLPLFGISQNFIHSEQIKNLERFEFGINFEKNNFLLLNKKEFGADTNEANQIFIEQIGANNNIDTYTSSENSDLKLFQYGDSNNISFMMDARNLDGTIIQEGNNNNAFDFTVNANRDVSANLLQQGDNLHFERYGANSISNNLKIIQTGETRSIIIRNFQ